MMGRGQGSSEIGSPGRDLWAGEGQGAASAQSSGPHWALCLRALILACPWLTRGEAPGMVLREAV